MILHQLQDRSKILRKYFKNSTIQVPISSYRTFIKDMRKNLELRANVTKSEKVKSKINENKENTFEKMNHFKYLGMTISNKADERIDI